MSEPAREYVSHYVKDDRPEVRARRAHLVKILLADDPELERQVQETDRVVYARSVLRRVLTRRGLVVRPGDAARVDACTDVSVLQRWLEEASVATTADEVFGAAPGAKPRVAAQRKSRSKTPR